MPSRRAVAVCVTAGLIAAALALGDQVPGWEIAVTRWWNAAPHAFALALWPVMQLGTVWAPLMVGAGLIAVRRDGLVASTAVVGGLATWYSAKLLKLVWERPRPVCCIADLDLRGATSAGFGFPSGHSAVAACCAVVVMAYLRGRWRWLPAGLAAVVGASRLVYGAHFPLDLIGGWALGVGIAAGTLAAGHRLGHRLL